MKHNFKELKIWQMGMDHAELTYLRCAGFPREELFGLSAQMKKAAVSIPANIAEGCGRGTDAQLVHFLDIALGSSCELETQVLIAKRLKYLSEPDTDQWVKEMHHLQIKLRNFRNKLSGQ